MTIILDTLTAPAFDSGRPSPDVRHDAGMIGDWLLAFSPREAALPARRPDDGWHETTRGPAWQVWAARPGDGWRGAPAIAVETPEWSACLIGELYATPNPAAAVADVVEGRGLPGALNGHFLLTARHRPSDEWHVWTNRHATLHAYLATNGSRTAVGTFLPAVAAAAGCADLDWEGLSTFFGSGFFAADRTHLAGVRILRPATHYRFDATGRLLDSARYWDWRHAPDDGRSYDDTLDAFAALFADVMGDLTAAGRIAVPISGGLDSRSTVATMTLGSPAAGRLWAYSYGYGDDSIETRIAGRVAAARDLPFDAFTIRPYLFSRLPAVMAAVEGFEDVTQCRQAAVVDEIDRRADYVIAAHLGDLYLNDMGLVDAGADADVFAVALKKVSKGGSDWLLANLCAPRLGGGEPMAVLRDAVAGEMARLETIAEPDFRVKAFKVDQWCARWTTVALRMFQSAAFPRLPFYDTRLADFFLTVPTAYVAGRRLQIDYLRRYAPDLARVPWQATGRDLFHNGRDGALGSSRRAVHKGWRQLTGRKTIERNWEVQFMGVAGRAGLAHHLLRSGLRLHEFVAPRVIGALLEAFERDPYADKRSYTVAMLLTFSAWLEWWAAGAPRP